MKMRTPFCWMWTGILNSNLKAWGKTTTTKMSSVLGIRREMKKKDF